LIRHGVTEAEARRIDATIEPDNVLLTVDGSDHPERVAQIVEACGGGVISGDSFVVTAIDWTGPDGLHAAPTLHEDFFISRFEDE
jgi:hypothetical protein